VHFFNTFFYKKLAQKHTKTEGAGDGSTGDGFKPGERAAHDRVKKWTKHVDIFSKARYCALSLYENPQPHAMPVLSCRTLSSCLCIRACTGHLP
jgi:hypothetical protein